MGWILANEDGKRLETREERLAREEQDRQWQADNKKRIAKLYELAEIRAEKIMAIITAAPPTEEEMAVYVARKIENARAFVEEDDPEFPTEELLRAFPTQDSANAGEFLEIARPDALIGL